ncbi:MAG TPA: CvpA family protein [Candidatus Binataceae bacterium]|nr:CvpA family protein [Candidatus Binataceae bacterium]
MNLFDYIVIAAMAVGALSGARRGLIEMLTAAASLVIGIYLASNYYPPASALAQRLLGVSGRTASVLGWIAVFVVVFAAVEIAGAMLAGVVEMVALGWLDQIAGAAIGAALAAVLCGFAVMLLAATLPPDNTLLRDSKIAPMLVAYDHTLERYIPQEVRDEYEINRRALTQYWVEQAERPGLQGGATPTGSASPAL